MEKSDILMAESSDHVVSWLLEKKKPHQTVMTTIIGRPGDGDEGVCDPNTWRKWYEKGCDFSAYTWGSAPSIVPDEKFINDMEITRQAYKEII